MTQRITRHRKARRDLVELGQYLKRRNPAAARRFLDAIERALRRLAAMPEMGGQWESDNPTLAGTRALAHSPVQELRDLLSAAP